MEKPTLPTRYRSGPSTLYLSSRFIYEVSLYRITRSGAALVKSQYYASDVPIDESKLQDKFVKLDADTTLAKFIDWLAAPKDYLVEHNYREENGKEANKRVVSRKNSRKKR